MRDFKRVIPAVGMLFVGSLQAQGDMVFIQLTDTGIASVGAIGDTSLDQGKVAFTSSADPTGNNSDSSREVFLWRNGAIEQVTDIQSAVASRPSLDAGSIAFTSNFDLAGSGSIDGNEVFLWDGAAFEQITTTSSSEVNDVRNVALDGDSIAFQSVADPTGGNPDGNTEIFYWSGTSLSQITDTTSGHSYWPSLDSGIIAFESSADLTGENPDGNIEIFVVNPLSGFTQITDATAGDSSLPSLDGSAIAFSSTSDLTGNNADGNSEIFFWKNDQLMQITDSTTLGTGSNAPSLDAGTISFHSDADHVGDNPDGNLEIFRWSEKEGIVQVTNTTNDGETSVLSQGSSLDGGSIVFESNADLTGGNSGLDYQVFLAIPDEIFADRFQQP